MARSRPDVDAENPPSPLELGQAAAAQLGGDWQLDAEPEADHAPDLGVQPPPIPPPPVATSPTPDPRHAAPDATPPSPEQIIEAMLFAGGAALTVAAVCAAVRGLTPDRFQAAIDTLNRRYRTQHRPYAVQQRDGGFVLALASGYRALRERVLGGPREARLSQPALDVLAVIAYRQPVGKAEIDAVRGTDSGGVLRQLVRLGLVAVRHRAEAGGREVRYGTTPRFLQVFSLSTLDELPRLGATEGVTG